MRGCGHEEHWLSLDGVRVGRHPARFVAESCPDLALLRPQFGGTPWLTWPEPLPGFSPLPRVPVQLGRPLMHLGGEVRPVRYEEWQQVVPRVLLDDEPALRVFIDRMMLSDLVDYLRQRGVQYVGPVEVTVEDYIGERPEDPRRWWRKAWDRLRRRPYVPPPPPVVLRAQVRCA